VEKHSTANRPQMSIWSMCIACWIPKTTDTLSEYVILLFHYNNGCISAPHCSVIQVTQKNGTFWKTQQKLKKSKKKILLTEIEPLQLAF